MKIYISSSTSAKPVYIDIVLNFNLIDDVLCSSIHDRPKIKAEKPNDELTPTERRELIGDELTPKKDSYGLTPDEQYVFNQFIGYFDGLLAEYQFDIKDDHPSNQSSSSYYFSFFGAKSNGETVHNKLFIARISTHIKEDSEDPTNYYRDMAERYKTPKSKKRQGYQPISVMINHKEYENYEDACDAVETIMKKIQSNCDQIS